MMQTRRLRKSGRVSTADGMQQKQLCWLYCAKVRSSVQRFIQHWKSRVTLGKLLNGQRVSLQTAGICCGGSEANAGSCFYQSICMSLKIQSLSLSLSCRIRKFYNQK